MPQQLTYPGVYVEEIPSGVRTIIGVSTSITAFLGRALRGPVNEPVRVQSFGEYERVFGGLWNSSTMSFAVQQYFTNGGSDAVIVRLYNDNGGVTKAKINVTTILTPIVFEAATEGAWGNNLKITIDHIDVTGSDFNMTIEEVVGGTTVAKEVYYNVNTTSTSARCVTRVLADQSALMRVNTLTAQQADVGVFTVDPGDVADDGADLTETQYNGNEGGKTGLYALEKVDIFNILCAPPMKALESVPSNFTTFWDNAIAYCRKRRAIVIVNPKIGWDTVGELTAGGTGIDSLTKDENAVFYFPNVKAPNPLRNFQLETFSPCGIAAGMMARTDAARGIWKAPAGLDANVRGVQALELKMTDGENGQLNPLGINCIRSFPGAGIVIWGARTLKGADRLASEWKYLPVRRLALYIEESLYRGSQWAVFEPNDEPLWSQLRLNVGAFMHQLFRQGAFQGRSPREAYFVKCDKETTTQNDINQGIVNVVIGFAPLKPAEFVVLKIQQIAGQIES